MRDDRVQSEHHHSAGANAPGRSGETSPPLQDLEEQFEDWVREIRLTLRAQDHTPRVPTILSRRPLY
jgi:hypothetical protein